MTAGGSPDAPRLEWLDISGKLKTLKEFKECSYLKSHELKEKKLNIRCNGGLSEKFTLDKVFQRKSELSFLLSDPESSFSEVLQVFRQAKKVPYIIRGSYLPLN